MVIPSPRRSLSPSKSTSAIPPAAASPNVKLREKNIKKVTSGSAISSEDMAENGKVRRLFPVSRDPQSGEGRGIIKSSHSPDNRPGLMGH